jgi:hypothetical protein
MTCITSNEKSNFYTYAYLDSSNSPYYIGKGQGNRAYLPHKNVTVPDVQKILFLKTDLTEAAALKHEEYMIEVIGRQVDGKGQLTNVLPRGSSTSIKYERQDPDDWIDPILSSIFGSKTAACVLLFVHRNEEAHALRIAKTFNFGLNQTQRQLKKFANESILLTRKVGSVRLYGFNNRLPTVQNLRKFLDSYVKID